MFENKTQTATPHFEGARKGFSVRKASGLEEGLEEGGGQLRLQGVPAGDEAPGGATVTNRKMAYQGNGEKIVT